MQLCHIRKASSLFFLSSSHWWGVLCLAFCMIEYGPHSGDSQSLLGRTSLNRSIASLRPSGFDRSKSSFVQRSAFRFAPCADFVNCEVGEQNTSTRSKCFSVLWINMAISVFSSLCHWSCSFASNLALDGGNGCVGSGAVSSFSCSLPVFRRRMANPAPFGNHNCRL